MEEGEGAREGGKKELMKKRRKQVRKEKGK